MPTEQQWEGRGEFIDDPNSGRFTQTHAHASRPRKMFQKWVTKKIKRDAPIDVEGIVLGGEENSIMTVKDYSAGRVPMQFFYGVQKDFFCVSFSHIEKSFCARAERVTQCCNSLVLSLRSTRDRPLAEE